MARLSLIVCLALAAAVAAEIHYITPLAPVDVGDRAQVAMDTEPKPTPPFTLMPLNGLGETVSRPLFMTSRRPPAPEPVVEQAPVQAPAVVKPTAPNVGKFVLSAVVIAEGQTPEAILRNPKTGKQERLQQGAVIAEWTLREVREDSVLLAWNDDTQEVALRTFKDPPKPRAAQQPTATAAAADQQSSPAGKKKPTRRQLTPAQRKRLEELRKRRRERRAAMQQQQQQQQQQKQQGG